MSSTFQIQDALFGGLLILIIASVFYTLWQRKQYHLSLQVNRQQTDMELHSLKQQMGYLQQQKDQLQQELEELDLLRDKSEFEARKSYGELKAAEEKLKQLTIIEQQLTQQQLQNESLKNSYHELQVTLREQEVKQTEVLKAANEKLQLLETSEQRLKLEFERLANQLFDAKVRSVDEQNKVSLNGLLSPLKEQLNSFKQQVNDSFNHEAKERHTLVHEIRHLQKLNEQMAQDAVNLTQALKGDNKQQGNWGEVVLAKVLQDSGLREGHEYQTQVSLQQESGKRYQPDVIVNLPENKQVVIDSKMTLIAYERFFNAETQSEQNKALSDHLLAMRNHIKQLSSKDYHQLKGITSLDYVLMFIPIEPAFQLASQADPNLVRDALEYNIILVSPTTLLVALRTIKNLWHNERQNQNAQLIAERASKLYDKMRLFIDDMEMVGQALDKAQVSYQGAMNKLSTGRGNLIRQAQGFKSLGVKVKKEISQQLIETAQNEFENDRQAINDKVN